MKRFFLTILVLILYNSFYGQSVKIAAVLDTNIIEFADQTMFRIQIQPGRNTEVLFPKFKDTIGDGIEIVEYYEVDTINQNPFTLEKSFLITSFVDSIRNIPALPIIVDLDTLWTNQLQILVTSLDIDSATLATIDTNQFIPIFDIKKPFDAPFTFREFWERFGKWILIGLLVLLIIRVVLWQIKKLLDKKAERIFEKPKTPAHILAFKELNKLKNKKIFHQKNTKEFYTELTLIVRTYIEQRFKIPALENTSNEILTNFDTLRILNIEQFDELRILLNVADLAKFAKYKPLQNTNESNFDLAYSFVDKTKLMVKENKLQENSTKRK